MTTTSIRRSLARRVATVGVVGLTAVAMTACSETSGDEEGTSVEDVQEEDAAGDGTTEENVDAADDELVYDGVYDSTFYDDVDSYAGETVTVSAEVENVISDKAFTIAGDDVEELLIVNAGGSTDIQDGSSLEVTGMVHTAFDLPKVEESTGEEFDDELYDNYTQEPYISATNVDTTLDESDDE